MRIVWSDTILPDRIWYETIGLILSSNFSHELLDNNQQEVEFSDTSILETWLCCYYTFVFDLYICYLCCKFICSDYLFKDLSTNRFLEAGDCWSISQTPTSLNGPANMYLVYYSRYKITAGHVRFFSMSSVIFGKGTTNNLCHFYAYILLKNICDQLPCFYILILSYLFGLSISIYHMLNNWCLLLLCLPFFMLDILMLS